MLCVTLIFDDYSFTNLFAYVILPVLLRHELQTNNIECHPSGKIGVYTFKGFFPKL